MRLVVLSVRVRVKKSMAAAAVDTAAGFDSSFFCDMLEWFMGYDCVGWPRGGNASTDD